jgi:hypothetical protein
MVIYTVAVVCLLYWSYTLEDQRLDIIAYQTDAGTLSDLLILRAAQIRQILLSVLSLRISQVQTMQIPHILP